MAKYSDDDLFRICQDRQTNSTGADSDGVSTNWAMALDYYYGRLPGNTKPGRSDQRSMDVADMVNAVMAQLTPMISSDAVVEFEAVSEEDREQATMESKACNRVVMEDNQGFVQFEQAIKDALLQRNCIIEVTADDRENVEVWTYPEPDTDPEGYSEIVAGVVAQPGENETRTLISDPGEWPMKVESRTKAVGYIVRAVDINNCLWDENLDSHDLNDSGYFGVRAWYTRSELVDRGIDKATVAGLTSTYETNTNSELARNRNNTNDRNTPPGQPEMEYIECVENYPLVDMNDDGIAERWHILTGGETVLEKSEVQWVPYAAGSVFITPHRFLGESLFDHLKSVQDTKSAALRQWIDNLAYMNNAELNVVESQVNVADLLNRRPGGVNRARSTGAIEPMPMIDGGPSSAALLGYQDKLRTERSGASLDLMAGDAQVVNNVSEGSVDRQFSSKELLAEMMARNIAETLVRQVYLILHQTMRAANIGEQTMPMGGRFVTINPQDWPERTHINVNAGLSVGQRRTLSATLGQWLQMQVGLMQQGSPLVNNDTMHRTAMSWLAMGAVGAPDAHILDPDSAASQEIVQQNQQNAQAQQQMAQQQAQMVAQMEQMKLQLEGQELTLKKYMHDTELQFKYADAEIKADTQAAETITKGITDAEKNEIDREKAESAGAGAPGLNGNEARA